MKIKKNVCVIVAVIILSLLTCVSAAGVSYFPDVTSLMSAPEYWANETDILMSYEEIQALNASTISEKATYMYDLKNHPQTIDGISLNEALLRSSGADASYYLGWTYIQNETLATQEDYNQFINNTQNPYPQKQQPVLYGIATRRTELRTFPSYVPIWDDPKDLDFDYQYLSSVRVNEPLVITSVSNDGKFYLAKSICCSGWVPADCVAICKDKAEWLSAWDIKPENVLVVYGDKIFTEVSLTAPSTSNLMLTMGTVLELADTQDPNVLIDNRAAYQSYAVWVPVRNEDGSYSKKLTLIPEHQKVSNGYLPLTKMNIAKVTFGALGNTYGWGGSLYSDDCSGYMRNVYKCFGIELARNTVWQCAMPMAKVDMQYMCREERESVLDAMPLGTILYFNGHEMMYLGSENENYYVVSSVSSTMQPNNSTVRQRIRSVVINTLEIKRSNGNTWLDELTTAIVPYSSADSSCLPQYAWYHEGVEFCLKNKLMKGDENKYFNPDSNITWAEILQIMWNKEGNPSVEQAEKKQGEQANWYDNAVNWATTANLIAEANNGFDPETAVTREQFASVLYLYAKHKGIATGNSATVLKYDDANEISDYAVDAIKFVVQKDIISGKTHSTINPKDYATRAETAAILQRFINACK